MNSKGLTYVELLVVLGLIPFVIGLIAGVLKVQDYFKTTRDLQRIQDLNSLNNALNFYFTNATSVDPDGPNLDQKGIDETYPTIFVSIPLEQYEFPATTTYNNTIFYFHQINKNDYQRIDGFGWVPINFLETNYPDLNFLPIDPINTFANRFYYLYAFRRNPLQYEISSTFESLDFKKGGKDDKVSTDGGNDDNRLEMGTRLDIIPPFDF